MLSVCPPPGAGGYPSQVPSPFDRLWSQVLSKGVPPVSGPVSLPGGSPVSGPMSLLGGTPVLSQVLLWGSPVTGVPHGDAGTPSKISI